MRNFILILLVSLFSFAALATPTTLILSRHAEKGPGDNPDLTKEGKDRAKALTKLTHLYNIVQVYSSNTRRTVATAEPIAKEMNLQVNTTFKANQFESMVADIAKKFAGKTVMVVGHSDTVPEFLNYLTKSKSFKEIEISDYSNLFVVQYEAAGHAQVHRYLEVLNGDKLTLEPR